MFSPLRQLGLLSLVVACSFGTAACGDDDSDDGGGSGSGGSAGTTASGGANNGGNTAGVGLATKYKDLFPIGVAVEPWHLTNQRDIVVGNFNHLTAENAMKFGSMRPQATTWSTADADTIVQFAKDNDMKLTGHTLVWHQQTPSWVFQGLTAGDPASIETLKERMREHINGMVERYADVVDNWDVVNEAIKDGAAVGDTEPQWRTGAENSQWYQYFGGPEYIEFAFQYAKEALEAKSPGSSAGKLYYNDYNETQKVDSILLMVEQLRSKNIQIDGIGLQAHWRVDWPPVAEIEATIEKIVAAGLKVKISELDITFYNDYPPPDYGLEPAPEVELTAALEAQQAERYRALFALFRKHAAHITSVTLWGTSDDRTWLDTFPVTRNDHPLLWDEDHQPKEAYNAILDF